MNFKAAIPVLRIFDEAKAKEFYVGFLGFIVDWEATLCEGSPLYLQVSRGKCVIHLSEHFGDSTPGSTVRIQLEDADLDGYLDMLREANYRHARPGQAQLQSWGLREITITDPFGNRLVFFSVPEEHRQPRRLEEIAGDLIAILCMLEEPTEPYSVRCTIEGTASGIPANFVDAVERAHSEGGAGEKLHELLVEYAQAHVRREGNGIAPKAVVLKFSIDPETDADVPDEEGVLRFPARITEILVE